VIPVINAFFGIAKEAKLRERQPSDKRESPEKSEKSSACL
jgi:hypothetical protein